MPLADGQQASWVTFDARSGQITTAPGAGELREAVALASQHSVLVLVPGEQVLLAPTSLPVRGTARMLQAAPYALEEQIAEDVSEMHFAVGSRLADGKVPVAAVRDDTMREWVDQLETAGIDPDQILPDTVGVPAHPGLSVIIDGLRCLVRDQHGKTMVGETDSAAALVQAFGLSPDSDDTESHLYISDQDATRFGTVLSELRMALPDLEIHTLRYNVTALLPKAALVSEWPNLLQGTYARSGAAQQHWSRWRRVAILAGALVLLTLGTRFGQLVSLKAEADSLNAELNQIAAEALPPNSRIVNPLVQLRQRASQLRSNGGGNTDTGFIEILQVLGQALAQANGATLGKLDYRNNTMDLTLSAPDVDTLDRIRIQLEGAGLQAEIQSANQIDLGVQGRVRIRRGES